MRVMARRRGGVNFHAADRVDRSLRRCLHDLEP
jgi:hypothetical protein